MLTKKQKQILISIIISVTICAFVVFLAWLKPNKPNKIPPPLQQQANVSQIPITNQNITDKQQPSSSVAVPLKQADTKPTTGLENLPQSLQGTAVDGEIIIDENKQLVVTYGLRRLFDYFLSTQGEEPDEDIHKRIKDYIQSRTPQPAASQAIAIYDNYVAYLKALTTIEKDFGDLQLRKTKEEGRVDVELLKKRRKKLNQLQQQFFDEKTINAFFSEENNLESYTFEVLKITNNDDLSIAQKEQARRDYIDSLPNSEDKNAIKIYQDQQANIGELQKRTEELKKQGASQQQLHKMRTQLVGAKAANRLAKVDKEEQNYEDRYQRYKQQKQTMINKYGKNSAKTTKEIEKIQQKLFNNNEQKRLTGYEAVQEQQ